MRIRRFRLSRTFQAASHVYVGVFLRDSLRHKPLTTRSVEPISRHIVLPRMLFQSYPSPQVAVKPTPFAPAIGFLGDLKRARVEVRFELGSNNYYGHAQFASAMLDPHDLSSRPEL